MHGLGLRWMPVGPMMTRPLRIGLLAGAVAAAGLHPLAEGSAAVIQDHHDHEHHDHGDPSGGHVMPPMPDMPMLPGLMDEVPPVSAWLPEFVHDPAHFPEARPSETVHMADGDTLDLVAAPVRRDVNGEQHLMYGYNEQYPGPFIQAEEGATIMVRVRNEVDWNTTVHWHGIRIENRFDGVPGLTQAPIEPGETFLYEVDVPDEGMFWYHPHHRSDVQQDLGLYGNLLVRPRPEEREEHRYHREELLTLDDLLLTDDGELVPYGEESPTHALMGRFGTTMLVNGSTDHRMEVDEGEVIRFYITNVASARTFNVRFGDADVKLVGSDLGAYEEEQDVESVVIAPAERYVVDVRFPESGEQAITNTVQAIDKFRGEFFFREDTLSVVDVGPERASPDLAEEHREHLRRADVVDDIDDVRRYLDREPDHELTATIRARDLPPEISIIMEADSFYHPPVEWNDPMPMMNWLATGEQVEWVLEESGTGRQNEEIHWSYEVGDVVMIRIVNDPGTFHPMNHPIHVHGQRFLVARRDGVPQDNLVWKDTANLPTGHSMDILVEMSNPGEWMLHCHNNEHLSSGMHMHFTVEEADR